jgi:two-component system, NarL family, nitrate/nitrite response regulator NarL
VRIVLCDDHRIFVEALAAVFAARGWTVCAHVLTFGDAEAAIAAHSPDVAVVGTVGEAAPAAPAAAVAIAARWPRTPVVHLAGPDDHAAATAAPPSPGPVAVVRKTDDLEWIIAVIERVGRGEDLRDAPSAPASRAGRVAARRGVPSRGGRPGVPHTRARDRAHGGPRTLTAREHEVLARLVAGQTTAVMAADMGVTLNTARVHVQNVLTKLGVGSRLEAVAGAIRAGVAGRPPGGVTGPMPRPGATDPPDVRRAARPR